MQDEAEFVKMIRDGMAEGDSLYDFEEWIGPFDARELGAIRKHIPDLLTDDERAWLDAKFGTAVAAVSEVANRTRMADLEGEPVTLDEPALPAHPQGTEKEDAEPVDLSEQFISSASDYLDAIEWQKRCREQLVTVTGECDQRGYSHSILAARAGLSRTAVTKYAAEARRA